MYPILKEHFGIVKGRLIGGAVWGVWHLSIMLHAAYADCPHPFHTGKEFNHESEVTRCTIQG